MATLSNFDQDNISRLFIIANFLHDHNVDLNDLNIALYTGGTGLIARLQAMPNGGQDALNELGGLGGMTVQEFGDVAYLLCAQVRPVIYNDDARYKLAATRKVS